MPNVISSNDAFREAMRQAKAEAAVAVIRQNNGQQRLKLTRLVNGPGGTYQLNVLGEITASQRALTMKAQGLAERHGITGIVPLFQEVRNNEENAKFRRAWVGIVRLAQPTACGSTMPICVGFNPT